MSLAVFTALVLHTTRALDSSRAAVTEASINTTDPAITNIRRQLMANNLDYMPSESSGEFLVRQLSTDGTSPAVYTGPSHFTDGVLPPLGEHVNDIFLPRARDLDLSTTASSSSTDRTIDKNDLLYYLHDDTLKDDYIDHDERPADITTPRAKYKILKAGRPGGRRSGSQRRFLQEETAEGVAIISLDQRPFPEFQLPQSRRQYMAAPFSSLEPLADDNDQLSQEMVDLFPDGVSDNLADAPMYNQQNLTIVPL